LSQADRNETIHARRRPALPEPPSPEPPPSRRRRTIAIVAAAVVASLGAGYGTAQLLGGGDDTGGGGGISTVARTAPAPAVERKPAGTLTTAGQALSDGARFDAPIPAGWRERSFAVRTRGGYLESRWSDPADARSYIIIDWLDGDRGGPQAAAEALRPTVAAQPGYREVRFEATRDGGWIWVYTVLDEDGRRAARIDLLSRHCGVLFAVLGSTSTKRFAELQRAFLATSAGIRLRARAC
jgi:hypothetical protein